jgi:hypothetical protein
VTSHTCVVFLSFCFGFPVGWLTRLLGLLLGASDGLPPGMLFLLIPDFPVSYKGRGLAFFSPFQFYFPVIHPLLLSAAMVIFFFDTWHEIYFTLETLSLYLSLHLRGTKNLIYQLYRSEFGIESV